MVQNTPGRSLEVQKNTDAKERHNDSILQKEVELAGKLIAGGSSREAKKHMDQVLIETQEIGTGFLPDWIEGIDLQNRAKNGRIVTMPCGSQVLCIDDNMTALVKNGSNLAKLIQLYIIANDGSVQKTDFSKILAGVDGDLERFTMQGLTHVIQGIRNRRELEKIKSDFSQGERARAVKGMGVDTQRELLNGGKPNETLRARREMSVDLLGDNLAIKSYGQSSSLNIKTGKITLGGPLFAKEYPITVHLVRDRDDKANPIFIESQVNRANITNAMKLMNLVHFVVSEFMNEKKKTIRDAEKPFSIRAGTLSVDDGLIMHTSIAKKETLDSLLSEAFSNTTLKPELLARFLNDIFRSQNPQNTIDRGSTFVGKREPISNKP